MKLGGRPVPQGHHVLAMVSVGAVGPAGTVSRLRLALGERLPVRALYDDVLHWEMVIRALAS